MSRIMFFGQNSCTVIISFSFLDDDGDDNGNDNDDKIEK